MGTSLGGVHRNCLSNRKELAGQSKNSHSKSRGELHGYQDYFGACLLIRGSILFRCEGEYELMDNLEQFLDRLVRDQVLFSSVEEAIRQAAVLPILHYLGWDTYNISEVIPEYRVGSGRVDYCLNYGGRKAVYIEVKRTLEDLDRHQKQLLEYAFTDGVELAVLTNGPLWWLFLPLSGGSWQQRRFFTIDVREQNSRDASSHFRTFLSKGAVGDKSALHKAQTIHAGKEKKRRISETIPRAWNTLLCDPDEELLELLASKVEGMCGYRPEPEQLARYISDFLDQQSKAQSRHDTQRGTDFSVRESTRVTDRTHDSENAKIRSQRQKGVKVQINGTTIEAESVSDFYYRVLKFLCDHNLDSQLDAILPFATSNQRYLVSRTPYHQRGNDFRAPVEYGGYYLEAHKSYKTAIKQMDVLLDRLGVKLEIID